MQKILVTGEKGGTGKSTVVALLIEYLNWKGYKTYLIDTDPLQVTQTYVNNCYSDNRLVSNQINYDYQVIDTAGVVGSALIYLNQADIIVIPFRPHYPDCQVIIPWFNSLNSKIQSKIVFFPNFWQNTKEQRDGLQQIKSLLFETKVGKCLLPLTNRPALYGTVLNGGENNFFNKNSATEIKKILFNLLKV